MANETFSPVDQWGSVYYTPVGTAGDGDPAYVFVYNGGAASVTVDVSNVSGTTNFVVGANAAYQYQMPRNSGAKFSARGELPICAVETVGANPSANNVHDWGFALVPEGNLTSVAICGWGPGSSDLSQNGSPVWVTAVGAATIYVDYDGDRSGPYLDPGSNGYDVAYSMAQYESRTIYDPDRDQTAMRVYTLDGTLLTAAWGQDPAVAGPSNPFLDMGTTILPFPVPVLRKSATVAVDTNTPGLSVGDTLLYSLTIDNNSVQALGNVIVIDAPPTNLAYVTNSSYFGANSIPDNPSGSAFPLDQPGYVIPLIPRGASVSITYRAVILAAGIVANGASIGAGNISVTNILYVPTAGSHPCTNDFTDAFGTNAAFYNVGDDVWIVMSDVDANNDTGAVESVTVVVLNQNNGDFETITLTETGPNTGRFMNTNALPSSGTAGQSQGDGVIYVAAGDTLYVSYTDPIYGDSDDDTIPIVAQARKKVLYLTTDGSDNDITGNLDRIDPSGSGDGTTSETAVMGSGGTAAIGVAGNSSTNATGVTSLTLSHTPGSGPGRLLLVSVAVGATGQTGAPPLATNCTYGGTSMQLVGTAIETGGTPGGRSYIFSLTNPASGPTGVVVRLNGSGNLCMGATTFTNVNQSAPLGVYTSVTDTGVASASIVVTSALGEVVFSTIAADEQPTVTTGAGQTELWNLSRPYLTGAASYRPGATVTTNSYTLTTPGGQDWALGAVAVRPASSLGGSNVVTFTQSPAFCRDFVMPAGGLITVTNYVSITNGSMPATASIAATLSYGSSNFFSDATASYDSSVSALVWSAALPAQFVVPSNQSVRLTVSNAQAGVAFRIRYDSSNFPSRVLLPASTVIDVETLGVYDAPYPGGVQVSSAANGATLYVRARVSDPFGAYDIRDAILTIDGPGTGGDVSNTLTDAHIVTSNACSKTYEYTWNTGSEPGACTITVTANEGTEGITDSAATVVTLSFLDLGTPSTTEFTFGNNGPHTNLYDPDRTVCVRVTDSDQNTNATISDTIQAVITTSGGDSELVTLTEVGTNSGVFTYCIAATSTVSGAQNDGVLYAPQGATLRVVYVDPDDPTDTSSDDATVPAATPSMSLTKMLVAPSDGQTVLGSTVEFLLTVLNNGSTSLSTVTLTDTHPPELGYMSASPAPSSSGGGTLTWNNVGPLSPGESAQVTVWFQALAPANPASNRLMAVSGSLTNYSSSTVVLSDPKAGISKTLLDPAAGPVAKGSNATFRIVVSNPGSTPIIGLPLEDFFSPAVLQFVTSSIPPDAVGAGSLLWTNLASVSALLPGQSITNDVTFLVIGAANPANNEVALNYAYDYYGDPLPPTNSVASVVTLAARIAGTVYDGNGTTGVTDDVGMQGVTIRLYSDPDGDGNPADGVLIAIATTSTNGLYEFLNLGAGKYVVVETDPPGYASTSDTDGGNADNRIRVNVVSITDYVGNDFIDDIPPSLATVTGQVRLDTDDDANMGDADAGIASVPISLVQDMNTNGLADPGEPVVQSTSTDGSGNYTFANVPPGHYVVLESDLFGYVSMNDSDSPNDNMVAVTAVAGSTSSGNDFLDSDGITIGDFVWADANRNGIQDGGESGLSNVVVTLYDAVSNTVGVTTSGVNGAYSFTGVGTGTYFVGFTALPGYAFTPANQGGSDSVDSDPDRITGATAPFAFLVGPSIYTIDAGLFAASPAMSIVKTAGNASDGGTEYILYSNLVVYSFTVTNAGDVPLVDVDVSDDKLGYIGTIAQLATNSSATLYATSAITATVTNWGSADGTPAFDDGTPLPGFPDLTASNDAVVVLISPSIAIAKTVNGAELVHGTNGTPVTYQLVVTNAGDVALSDVTVNDTALGLSTNIGSLAAGSSATLTVPSSITTDLTNTVTVTADDPNGDPWTDTDDAVVDLIGPAITLDKGVSLDGSVPGLPSVQATNGAALTYSFVVRNTGDVTLTNAVITDGFIAYTNSIGDLAAGQAVTVSVARTASIDLTNTASVTAYDPTGQPRSDDGLAIVDLIRPEVAIAKTVNGAELVQGTNGTPVTYQLVVTNAGDVTLSDVTVTDAALGLSTNIGSLAAGASATITVLSSITTDMTNTATVTAKDPNGDPWTDTDTASVDLFGPAITLDKTVSLNGSVPGVGSVQATNNAALTYSFVVKNTGDVTLTNAVITDSFISLTTNIGDLAAGQAVTVSVARTASIDLTNTASVTAYDTTGQPRSDDGLAIVDLIRPEVAIAKTVNGAELVQGTNGTPVTYQLVVTNAGDVTLSDVTVTDTALGLSTNIGALAAGSSSTLTVLSSITTDMTNTVTVTAKDPNGDPWTDTDTAEVDLISPAITLDKTVSLTGAVPGVGSVQATNNAALTYSFVVKNTGDVTLTNAVITDSFISLTTNIGDLAAGQAVTVSVARTASVDLTNTASVTAYDPTGQPRTDDGSAIVDLINPSVAIAKTVNGAELVQGTNGTPVTYQLVVTNAGDVALSDVTVTDTALGLSTNIGSLAAGASATITVPSSLTADMTNTATVTAKDPNGDPWTDTDDAVVLVVNPAFTLVKSVLYPTNRQAVVGEAVAFSIAVTNTGDVTLSSLPLADIYSTNYLSFSNAIPAPADVADDGAINWADLGPLPPGGSTNVIVLFTARDATPSVQTNAAVATPGVPPGMPPPPPQTNGVPYGVQYVSIGDSVWIDANGNGTSDENLATAGINGVRVTLYRWSGSAWTQIAQTNTYTDGSGNRGHYQFGGLTFGLYRVDVMVSDIPSAYNLATTLTQIIVPLGPGQDYYEADFGFRYSRPTAVTLAEFSATWHDGTVRVTWRTLAELQTAGFNVHRTGESGEWKDLSGAAAKLNGQLIPGSASGSGGSYHLEDAGIVAGPPVYYWLEEIDRAGHSRVFGPIRVLTAPLPAGALVSYRLPPAQADEDILVTVSADELRRSGLPVDATDASEFKAWAGTNEMPIYVSAWSGTMTDGDFILLYLRRQAGHDAQISLGVGQDALRMQYVYAGPVGGDLSVNRLVPGTPLVFSVGATHNSCLITGVKDDSAVVLDVTDHADPRIMFGYAFISIEGDSAIYLSYFPEVDPARCLLAEPDAFVDIREMDGGSSSEEGP